MLEMENAVNQMESSVESPPKRIDQGENRVTGREHKAGELQQQTKKRIKQ